MVLEVEHSDRDEPSVVVRMLPLMGCGTWFVPTGTKSEPTQTCCYLHDFRHTRNSEPTRNQAEPCPEPAS